MMTDKRRSEHGKMEPLLVSRSQSCFAFAAFARISIKRLVRMHSNEIKDVNEAHVMGRSIAISTS